MHSTGKQNSPSRSYRLPVMMTSQCNLPEGFDAQAAIEIEPEVTSITDGLMSLFCLRETELKKMGQRGHTLVEKLFSWSSIATEMCAVYEWVLGRRPKPPCVITD